MRKSSSSMWCRAYSRNCLCTSTGHSGGGDHPHHSRLQAARGLRLRKRMRVWCPVRTALEVLMRHTTELAKTAVRSSEVRGIGGCLTSPLMMKRVQRSSHMAVRREGGLVAARRAVVAVTKTRM
jgi:hypothetical protein